MVDFQFIPVYSFQSPLPSEPFGGCNRFPSLETVSPQPVDPPLAGSCGIIVL